MFSHDDQQSARLADRFIAAFHLQAIGIFAIRRFFIFCLAISFSGKVAGDGFDQRLAAAALERTAHTIRYDGSYYPIAYPGGDVPADVGACTDVLIRAFRTLGVDLQILVHEDMTENFAAYPSQRIWGLAKPDPNIDHRRVPNLQVFFSRHGQQLRVSQDPADYLPGDIVTWMLPRNLPHIGMVSDRTSDAGGNPMMVHNIGAGPKLEDMLFEYPITGHFRFTPESP